MTRTLPSPEIEGGATVRAGAGVGAEEEQAARMGHQATAGGARSMATTGAVRAHRRHCQRGESTNRRFDRRCRRRRAQVVVVESSIIFEGTSVVTSWKVEGYNAKALQ